MSDIDVTHRLRSLWTAAYQHGSMHGSIWVKLIAIGSVHSPRGTATPAVVCRDDLTKAQRRGGQWTKPPGLNTLRSNEEMKEMKEIENFLRNVGKSIHTYECICGICVYMTTLVYTYTHTRLCVFLTWTHTHTCMKRRAANHWNQQLSYEQWYTAPHGHDLSRLFCTKQQCGLGCSCP